jgi:hypothetical protein
MEAELPNELDFVVKTPTVKLMILAVDTPLKSFNTTEWLQLDVLTRIRRIGEFESGPEALRRWWLTGPPVKQRLSIKALRPV